MTCRLERLLGCIVGYCCFVVAWPRWPPQDIPFPIPIPERLFRLFAHLSFGFCHCWLPLSETGTHMHTYVHMYYHLAPIHSLSRTYPWAIERAALALLETGTLPHLKHRTLSGKHKHTHTCHGLPPWPLSASLSFALSLCICVSESRLSLSQVYFSARLSVFFFILFVNVSR